MRDAYYGHVLKIARKRCRVKTEAMATLVIEDLLERVHMTQDEFLVDLACYLYDKERLSFGKCRQLCGLYHVEFQKALAAREIDIKYTREDLDTDLKNMGITL